MLKEKILNKESGLLFYGLTPPKVNTDEERITTIANKQIERLKGVKIDGLILYDLQDESSRTNAPRPFPYLETLSPDYYSDNFLQGLDVPKIIYKSVGKYSSDNLKAWIENDNKSFDCSVFVGSPSQLEVVNLSLNEAYKIKQEADSSLILGGVTIPERHNTKRDEHIRLYKKINNGCSFFVSQCVYNINNTKDFLSDYYYYSIEKEIELVPIIFTLTPCGSQKTLEFMKWLGIDIPKWLSNDLIHSENILENSIKVCKAIATEILEYSRAKNIPIGFNIESVAIRKEEIEASIQLLKDIGKMMNK